MQKTTLVKSSVSTPIGNLNLYITDLGLAHIQFEHKQADHMVAKYLDRYYSPYFISDELTPLAQYAHEELQAYFSGQLYKFDTPLDLRLTPFATRVLQLLTKVAYGKSITYGELAELAGNPRAARAVGWAVAHNPIPIVVPCHRVVPASGGIGNYGAGVDIKEQLLSLEHYEM